jgi:hypothetical protein
MSYLIHFEISLIGGLLVDELNEGVLQTFTALLILKYEGNIERKKTVTLEIP